MTNSPIFTQVPVLTMGKQPFRLVAECPREGQFVALWAYLGKPWSSTYRVNERGDLDRYDEVTDSWVPGELLGYEFAYLIFP